VVARETRLGGLQNHHAFHRGGHFWVRRPSGQLHGSAGLLGRLLHERMVVRVPVRRHHALPVGGGGGVVGGGGGGGERMSTKKHVMVALNCTGGALRAEKRRKGGDDRQA
jgi:hypothetical protein